MKNPAPHLSKENKQRLTVLENVLLQTRGYVYKEPLENEPVVLLVSGGIDSITAWKYLLIKKNLEVFPLYISSKRFLDPGKTVVEYFDKQYQQLKNVSELYHPPHYWSTQVNRLARKDYRKLPGLSKEAMDLIVRNQLSPLDAVLFNGSNSMYISLADQYRKYLFAKTGKKISKIYYCINVSDGEAINSQTLLSLISQTISLCEANNDYTIEVASPFLNHTENVYMKKADVINLAHTLNIPLQRTRTCESNPWLDCGTCLVCQARRYEFSQSDYMDNTKYLSDWSVFKRGKQLIDKLRYVVQGYEV